MKPWLVVLQMNINAPASTLRPADQQVCSEHFTRTSHIEEETHQSTFPDKLTGPRAEKRAADRVVLILQANIP